MPRLRYRIQFTGPVAPGIVAWLQRLIPVLRDAPPDVQVTVQIDHDDQQREDDDDRARPDQAG